MNKIPKNGKGYLIELEPEGKKPNFRGTIEIENRKFVLCGWSKNKNGRIYLSLVVNEEIVENTAYEEAQNKDDEPAF